MHHLILLAVTQKSGASITDAFPHLVGMLMVMVTLAILWGVCSLTAFLVKTFLPAVVEAAATPTVPQDIAHLESSSVIPPEIVAVIAAAANSVLGGNYKIISIRPQDSNWERAGRQAVLSSHKLR